MDQLPWRNRRKGIPPGSTSHGLEAWSPPFQLRQFPSTDTDPTALPPRPTRAADEIGAESWKELKAFSTYLKDIYPGLLSNPKSMPSNSPFREPEFSYKMKSLQDFTISFLNIRESLTFSFYHWDSLTCLIWKVHRGRNRWTSAALGKWKIVHPPRGEPSEKREELNLRCGPFGAEVSEVSILISELTERRCET